MKHDFKKIFIRNRPVCNLTTNQQIRFFLFSLVQQISFLYSNRKPNPVNLKFMLNYNICPSDWFFFYHRFRFFFFLSSRDTSATPADKKIRYKENKIKINKVK